MRVLVAHSYFLRLDRKQLERAKPYPPLATLQVASMLRGAGLEVSMFDAMLAEGTEEYRRQLAACQPQLVLFYEDSFNFLSKMCLERMRLACCQMISDARAADSRVLVVGPDASDTPQPYLSAGADAVLPGEALESVLTLSQRLASDPDQSVDRWLQGESDVALLLGGVTPATRSTRNARSTRTARAARPTPAQSHVERPAWDLIDLDRYRTMWQQAHGYFSLNMAASRGCSFGCNWCSKPIWGNQYLQREAQDVAQEMIELKQRFRPDHIWFADDIFGFRADWVLRFASALHAGSGALPFTIQTRPDLITVAMAEALRLAGCSEVWIGAESGSQRVLDAMNKGTSIAQILTARDRLRAQGIRVGFFIQLGYLGEELQDLLATRALIERAAPDDVGVSVSYPLPGTPFHNQVKRQLGQKSHWRESNDLAMMFHGTYVSDFYRTVRNLLHQQVTAQQLTAEAGARRSALLALEQRWDTLIADEHIYRYPAALAATASVS